MSWRLDLTDVKPETGFELMPKGDYLVQLIDAEIKQTKAGTGEYINCKFQVLEGEFKNRFLFHMFNIKNPSAKAVKIGVGQIKKFLNCAGATKFDLTSVIDIVGYSAIAIVKIQIDEYSPDGKNVISDFKPKANQAQQQSAMFKSDDGFF